MPPGEASKPGESEQEDVSLGVDALDYDYTNFYFGSGEDAFALLEPFKAWWEQVHPRGYYQYELPLHSAPATTVAGRRSNPASRDR